METDEVIDEWYSVLTTPLGMSVVGIVVLVILLVVSGYFYMKRIRNAKGAEGGPVQNVETMAMPKVVLVEEPGNDMVDFVVTPDGVRPDPVSPDSVRGQTGNTE